MKNTKLENMATGTTTVDPEFSKAHQGYQTLLNGFQSIQLGTVNQTGIPEASYSPSVMDEERNLYVHVSELASHTSNLKDSRCASVLIIEDEAGADTIFARKRVTFQCDASPIQRHSDKWEIVMAQFEEKFGKMVGFLKTMEDFHLFKLSPKSGRLVLGFGKAYDVSGAKLNQLAHVGAGSGGAHRKESGHRKEAAK